MTSDVYIEKLPTFSAVRFDITQEFATFDDTSFVKICRYFALKLSVVMRLSILYACLSARYIKGYCVLYD